MTANEALELAREALEKIKTLAGMVEDENIVLVAKEALIATAPKVEDA